MPATTEVKPEAAQLSNDEILRYSRHLIMPEVGMEGQQKLKAAKVLCIGAGGLGSPLALYLTAAGVGTLGIVDFDVVDYTNLQRQIIHSTADVGRKKLESAGEKLKVVARAGVGVDNIDVEAATTRGVIVVNSPTGNVAAAAEHTVALLLALARHVPAATASLKSGKWERSRFVGIDVLKHRLNLGTIFQTALAFPPFECRRDFVIPAALAHEFVPNEDIALTALFAVRAAPAEHFFV